MVINRLVILADIVVVALAWAGAAGAVTANTTGGDRQHAGEYVTQYDYEPPYLALALKAGTLGPGAELTLGIVETLNLRGGVNYFPLKFNSTIKDIDYDVDATWFSVPMMLDWHPLNNNFRFTGGVIYNRNKGELNAVLTENQKIGDHEYPPDLIGTLTGKATFRTFAPYAGIGFGDAVRDVDTTWNFSFDLGVMFQGVPAVSLEADGPANLLPEFQQDLKQEEDKVQDEADIFRFYPVLSFGISYQF